MSANYDAWALLREVRELAATLRWVSIIDSRSPDRRGDFSGDVPGFIGEPVNSGGLSFLGVFSVLSKLSKRFQVKCPDGPLRWNLVLPKFVVLIDNR